MKPWHLALFGCVLVHVWSAHAIADQTPPASTQWRVLPLPDDAGRITNTGREKSGGLWIQMEAGFYFWDGKRFRSPAGIDQLPNYAATMVGGTDRDLYFTQMDGREHAGKLYQLKDGGIHYVTDYHYDNGGQPAGLHVTRTGQIYNWGPHFLEVYADGEWSRHDLDVGAANVQVIEVGDRTCILGEKAERLYVVDADGQITKHKLTFGDTVPLEKPPRIFPWGQRRLIATSQEVRSILAFDIESGEPVGTSGLNGELRKGRYFSVFGGASVLARGDGSVWLRSRVEGMYAFHRISPSGKVTFVEGSASKVWTRGAGGNFPSVFQETSDGAMWFALEDSTIARYQAGRLQRFDWRDGLGLGKFIHLQEGSHGEVYAASQYAIAVWNVTRQEPVPTWTLDWDEFESASYSPIRDSGGNVWVLLSNRPGEISRWDGTAWHHQSVPFDTAKIYGGMADDQGHVLLVASPTCYDISPAGVTTFPNVEAAAVAAVARGVKRIDGGIQVCIAGKQIWTGASNANEVRRYDGERWETLSLSSRLSAILPSLERDVLVRDEGGTFYEYDHGQLKYVTDTGSHTRWLWGSAGMQPYEPALLDRWPRDYAIVQHDKLTTRVQEVDSDGVSRTVFVQGDMMPKSWWLTLTRGFKHGHWTDYAAGPLYRLIGKRSVECDWQQTPLMGRDYLIRRVIEDRAGNLWIHGAKQIFMKRLGNFQLEGVGTPQIEDDAIHVAVEMSDAWQGSYQPRIFWRKVGGSWQGGNASNRITIPKSRSGDEMIEIIGMDRLGGTTGLLQQRIDLSGDVHPNRR